MMKTTVPEKPLISKWIVGFLFIALMLSLGNYGIINAKSAIYPADFQNMPTWTHKVDTAVLQKTNAGLKTEFIVLLTEQADLSDAATLRTKEEKGRFVFEHLTAVAELSQAPLRDYLDARKISHQSFWINNMLLVYGDTAVVETMARRSDVQRVLANTAVAFDPPQSNIAPRRSRVPTAVEWGIAKINADDVWALGYTGQGVVVAGQDTGYDWDHAALKLKYRGWDAVNNIADHDYNWHDAIHMIDTHLTGSNPCGLDSLVPCDDNGHGTHTMGTMIGDGGAANQIGVAPGAEWISCRNMERGWGTPITYAECFQWFIAPTELDGSNPDPAKAPAVINNSWSCPASEGCDHPFILQTVTDNVRAAGIFVAVSAGNSGSFCSTVATPAAIYDASFTVGATDGSDGIAGFSSRGPVMVDSSGRFKPDVSAPGVNVRSSTPGGNYGYSSGTSMAGPHVAGAVALLISADPSLAGQVDKIEQILRNTAVPLTSAQTCGGLPGSQSPNHTFGYGRIDVLAAVNDVLSPPVAVTPMPTLDVTSGDPVLNWPHDRANCQYGIFRSDNMPYFSPLPGSHLATMWADTNMFVDQTAPNPVENILVNAYYQVQALNCGVDTAVSQTVGEFDFALTGP